MNLGGISNPQRLIYTALKNKRFWIPVFILAFACLYSVGNMLPKKYWSSTKVRIYSPDVFNASMGDSKNLLKVQDRLATIIEEIKSYDFMAGIVHDLNMDRGIVPNSPDHQRMILGMIGRIDIWVKNQDLFNISFMGYSPQEARNVADAIAKKYIRNSSAFYETRTNKSVEFLETELADAHRRLTLAQESVLRYKQANINSIPDAQDRHIKQLDILEGEQIGTLRRIASLERQLPLAREELAGEPDEIVMESQAMPDDNLRKLLTQKSALEFRLDGLLQNFTEEHWQVKETKQEISLIVDTLAKLGSGEVETITTSGPNPHKAELKQRISDMELELARLKTDAASRAVEIKILHDYMAKIPENQLELERIEGAKNMALSQVIMYSARLNEAKVTNQIERRGQGPTFEILERARLPLKHASPNPKKLFILALGLSGMAAIAVILLLALLDNAVRTVEEARAMLQMPVLGVMQRIVTASEIALLKRRRKRRMIGMGASAMLLVALTIVSLTIWREPILEGVDQLRSYLVQN